MRKIFSIRIGLEVYRAARERGLNISRICENALILAVQKGENLGTVGSGLVGSPGFEPGSRTPEARSLDQASRRPLSISQYFQK